MHTGSARDGWRGDGVKTRVLIVEDEPELLQRLSEAVTADPGLQLVAAVSTGRAARALLEVERPDVMMVDLGLPDIDGVDVIRHAAAILPQCDVLVVSVFGDDAHVMASLEAGATGYLLKDASTARVAAAIHELRAGGAPISPSIARRVLQRFRVPGAPSAPGVHGAADSGAAPASTPRGVAVPAAGEGSDAAAQAVSTAASLSARESEILRLIAKGLPFETVGEVLGVSAHTVVTHVKKIYRKLQVHSRGEAVYEAQQMGLL
ncbi:MAG: response regulator transcription factor [Rubrivivax sp.]|nr:response regulator transcription factor [Rubrivivax sp.]